MFAYASEIEIFSFELCGVEPSRLLHPNVRRCGEIERLRVLGLSRCVSLSSCSHSFQVVNEKTENLRDRLLKGRCQAYLPNITFCLVSVLLFPTSYSRR